MAFGIFGPFIMMPYMTYLQYWALVDYCWGGAKFICTTRSPMGSPMGSPKGGRPRNASYKAVATVEAADDALDEVDDALDDADEAMEQAEDALDEAADDAQDDADEALEEAEDELDEAEVAVDEAADDAQDAADDALDSLGFSSEDAARKSDGTVAQKLTKAKSTVEVATVPRQVPKSASDSHRVVLGSGAATEDDAMNFLQITTTGEAADDALDEEDDALDDADEAMEEAEDALDEAADNAQDEADEALE